MVRVLGFNDELTVCEHCGKTDLKGTYAVEDNETITRYGSVCIGYIYGKKTGKAMTERARLIERLRTAKDRVGYAAQYLGWGTRQGWIVDGIGQRVIEAA